MRRTSLIPLLLAILLLSACRMTPKYGRSTTEHLVRSMTIEEKRSLLVIQNGHTASLERMGIPSVTVSQIAEIPGKDQLLRTWNRDLAYQAGVIIGAGIQNEPLSCVMCPVFHTEDTAYSVSMTVSLANGISECGHGLVLGPDTPDLISMISQVQPWAVILDDSIPQIPSYFGPVFVTGKVDESIGEKALDLCVSRVLSFVERTAAVKEPRKDMPLPDAGQYRLSLDEQGVVMLKNNGMIPLGKGNLRLALYGKASYGLFDAGIRNEGFKLEPSVASFYSRKSDAARQPFQYRADAIASNAAVLVFNDSLNVSDRQLVSDICDAFHSKSRKVAVVLATGGPVAMECWTEQPDAILYAGNPDQNIAEVVARIFKGTVIPSGRLERTWDEAFCFGFGLIGSK